MAPVNTASSQQEIVTQSEVEQLLAQIGGPEGAAADGAGTEAGAKAGTAFEFPAVSTFSVNELRKLRLRQEDFIRVLAAQLSIHLRLECMLQMQRLESMSFQHFIGNFTGPTQLALLRLEPLRGVVIMDIAPELAVNLLDRELGGPGTHVQEPRELSKMEIKLLSGVVEIIIGEWCASWRDLMELRPVPLGSESNGRFLKTCSPETMMLVLAFDVQMGEVKAPIQLAFPHYTLEPLVHKLSSGIENGEPDAGRRPAALIRWNPALNGMLLGITARMPDVEIMARQLADLKPEDAFPIPLEAAGKVQLCLEGAPTFCGTLGTTNHRWAVQIQRRANPDIDDFVVTPAETLSSRTSPLDVPVRLGIEIASCFRTAADILAFSTGSVVNFDRRCDTLLNLRANGKLFGRGQLIVIGESLGIKVAELVSPSN